MRTVPFKRVFDRTIRLLGLNPQKNIDPNTSRPIVEHINDRVREAVQGWNWPEWDVTEERAFRQIWNSTRQYLRVSDLDGQPDEVYDVSVGLYYQVLATAPADPPVGVRPSATATYWTQLSSPIDTYIAYDQTCRRAIGMVRGVYSSDPRLNGSSCSNALFYHITEQGVEVSGPIGPTVFINYSMPVPQYTIVPYVVGKAYSVGDLVFDQTVGECFQAIAATAALPSDQTAWKRVPFLEKWATFVVQGSYADCLDEFDQGGNEDIQAKQILAQKAEQKAQDALEAEVDALRAQGQLLKYSFCKRQNYWLTTQPWSGGTVTTIDEDCQTDLGWIYPTPPTAFAVVWQYHPEIVSLKGAAPNLQSVPTRRYMVGSRYELLVDAAGNRVATSWVLVSGAGNAADPGVVQPSDYDATTNSKHWEQQS